MFGWLFSFIYRCFRLPICVIPPQKRLLIVMGDNARIQDESARIQDETTKSSAAYSTITRDLGLTSHPKDYY